MFLSQNLLVKYKAENGDCDVPQSYETECGVKLGQWVNVQRKYKEAMDEYRTNKLEGIGFQWTIVCGQYERN